MAQFFGTTGNDTLIGGLENDVLIGAGGADVLQGGAGSDTYQRARGDGSDVIVEMPSGTDVDTLEFAPFSGALPTQFSLLREGNDLILRDALSPETVRVVGQYAGNGAGIEQIKFADASIWGATEITNAPMMLRGSGGNDTLNGGNGNDTLLGYEGYDLLQGGSGSDTYQRSDEHHDDNDVIIETASAADVDTLEFMPFSGVLPADVSLFRRGDDLIIRSWLAETRVVGQYSAAGAGIESIKFANGAFWGETEIANAPMWLVGTSNSETLTGASGNDTLIGAQGDDVLQGGTGTDTYQRVRGDGNDTIMEVGSDPDTLEFTPSAGVLASQVNLLRQGNDLVVRDTLSNETVRVVGQYAGAGIETIKFSDGSSWCGPEIANAALNLLGGITADTLTGAGGNDTLNGGAGNDTLSGGAGNDSLIGGDGADVLLGGLGKDSLTGGAGNDRFDFDSLAEMGLNSTTWDVVTDFVRGQDKIDLSTLDANTATATNDAFSGFVSASKAFSKPGQLKFTGGVLYGNTDADVDAEFAIQLVGLSSLSSSDIVL